MSAAKVLDLNDPCAPTEKERFKELCLKAAQKFIDQVADLVFSDETMTIKSLSMYFQEHKHLFLAQAFEQALKARHKDYIEQNRAICPGCEKEVARHGAFPRKFDTLQGSLEIERPYFYCRDCKLGFFPLDQALGLAPERKQYDLQALAAEFSAEVTFERASELFEKATGISFADSRMHSHFNSFAGQATLDEVIPSREEIENRINQVAKHNQFRPILVVVSDGAHVKIRPPGKRNEPRGPGEYNEAKGFRIYLLDKDQIVQVASWHQKANSKEITIALKSVAKRIPRNKVRVCLIGDGAHWLWDAMTEAFPGARQVLDYYHAKERINALGQSCYPEDPKKALYWVESAMARLSFKNGARHVIGGLKRMKPQTEEAKKLVKDAITYLTNNKQRFNYRGARVGGYHIGSGAIESANKFICHTRLKRSGAWWLETNCNNMLKVRCAIVNGTFDEAFEKYVVKRNSKPFPKKS